MVKMRGILLEENNARIVETDVPKPGRDEVLVKTKACGICMGEVYVFQGKLPGGKIMGHEGVGIVVQVGDGVKEVGPGDRVTTLGGPAFAEYYKTNKWNVAKIPEEVPERDLIYWISEPLACAVTGIKGSNIQIGDKVCIIGCGYMGLLLIQLIPKDIVGELIAIDIRDKCLDLARRFGARYTLNPLKSDVAKETREILGGEADIVIEASGAPGTIYLATEIVRRGGRLVIFGRHVVDEKVPTEEWHVKGLTILNTSPSFSNNFNKDFFDAVNLLKRGVVDQRPLITHIFPYTKAQEAFELASRKPLDYIKGVLVFS
ncbi:zinc-binding dehydrogenase [Candidatus Bathyarchaeota archaeon]|nr:zinc-binding dehydrogenase [Candidatus Bathyarchaeota archaeon]